MRIMQDVFMGSEKWIRRNAKKAVAMGITHIVIEEKLNNAKLRDQFQCLEIESSSLLHNTNNKIDPNPFVLMPVCMDFLRKVAF